ncbi:MAG: NCS2 family permease [Lentisphaerae bacterium]|nr:NCS2 family permease [Lentisphaerota bacterium]
MLERLFRLSENRTTVRTELLAGVTTFLTMVYIIFVQPAVLSGSLFGFETGMDFRAVMAATCLAAAAATAVMAFYGRYPIALAPGMGENFFFVLSVMPAAAACGFAEPWRVALGVVFVSGVLFYVVYLLGIRERIFDALSPSMKNGIAVGIGLFIAFIGLQNAGLIVTAASIVPGTNPPALAPGTLVRLTGSFASPDIAVFAVGLVVTAALRVRGSRGSILWGIAAALALALALRIGLPRLAPALWESGAVQGSMLARRFQLPDPGLPAWKWFVSLPPSLGPVFMKMDIASALSAAMWPFIVIFVFMDTFDTIGTLIGVGEQAGFMRDNRLPRVREAMLADQSGTLIGAVLGTSTTTSYIESAAGVEAGGRTGLTGITVSALFLLALFFCPLVSLVGNYPPVTAPALVIVGAMMVRNVCKVDWNDFSEAVPAFLTMIGIPLSYSIADGLALGFISYPLIKLLSGRGRETGLLMYVLGAALVAYFILVRSRL